MTAEQKKQRIFEIIQIGHREDRASRAFDFFIVCVIVLNIAVLILETFDALAPYAGLLDAVETATLLIFCVEYILRLWTSDCLYPGLSRKKALLRFILSFDGIVDLLTILPFFFLSGFAAFRMLRVVRIFHLFRINAYYDSFNVITSVLLDKKNQLISSIFIILVLMLASSLGMYAVEHNAQPEVYRNAFSGVWWSLSTIFTVGYGDIYPITTLGRAMAVVITFLGVGAVAIPTGIISAGFVEHYTKMQRPAASLRQTVSMVIDEQSPYLNHSVEYVEQRDGRQVLVLIRSGDVLLPSARTRLRAGDTAILHSEGCGD